MKRFSLQLAAFTAFCLGLIWFAGEGEALQSSHAGEIASGDVYATDTLHINLDEMRGKKREKGAPRLSDGVYRHTRKLSEAILDIPEVQDVQSPTNAQILEGVQGGFNVRTAGKPLPVTTAQLKRFRRDLMSQEMFQGTILAKDQKAFGIMVFFKNWLLKHIMTVDRTYIPYCSDDE